MSTLEFVTLAITLFFTGLGGVIWIANNYSCRLQQLGEKYISNK